MYSFSSLLLNYPIKYFVCVNSDPKNVNSTCDLAKYNRTYERIMRTHFNVFSDKCKHFPCLFTEYIYIQGVSGEIVNILVGGSMDYSK